MPGNRITLVGEIDAPDITTWFTHWRKTPGERGKMRSERTVQTYARSARAFFHWLARQEMIADNPFQRVTFPKVGKPLLKTISDEEFEQLLLACAPPNEDGLFAERATVRNRAILWLFFDSGIRLSELTKEAALTQSALMSSSLTTMCSPWRITRTFLAVCSLMVPIATTPSTMSDATGLSMPRSSCSAWHVSSFLNDVLSCVW